MISWLVQYALVGRIILLGQGGGGGTEVGGTLTAGQARGGGGVGAGGRQGTPPAQPALCGLTQVGMQVQVLVCLGKSNRPRASGRKQGGQKPAVDGCVDGGCVVTCIYGEHSTPTIQTTIPCECLLRNWRRLRERQVLSSSNMVPVLQQLKPWTHTNHPSAGSKPMQQWLFPLDGWFLWVLDWTLWHLFWW